MCGLFFPPSHPSPPAHPLPPSVFATLQPDKCLVSGHASNVTNFDRSWQTNIARPKVTDDFSCEACEMGGPVRLDVIDTRGILLLA